MDILSAVVTLVLIMDPLGDIPLFLSTLNPSIPPVPSSFRAAQPCRLVLLREIGFAYVVLLA